MTTIDTLLTLDADDPALRRGIAEMRGYEFKEGRWSDDYWLMCVCQPGAGTAGSFGGLQSTNMICFPFLIRVPGSGGTDFSAI